MKKTLFLITLLTIIGCTGYSHKEKTEEQNHPHIHSFVAYTNNLELFMQHEGLESGKKSCITIYATTLNNFKPCEADSANIILSVDGNRTSSTAKAKEKGIYHFDFAPESAGEGTLYFDIAGEHAHFDIEVNHAHSEACSHTHSHDGHNHAEHADHDHSTHGHSHSHAPHPGHGMAVESKDGDITFNKEQSWNIDFATEVVHKSSFENVIKIAAKVDAVPDNFTTIVATASGKVQFAGNIVAGKEVAENEPLFYLDGSDVTENDVAVKYAEAESEYILAKADYERKKLLFIDKIVSEREYQTAEATYRRAEARLTSMQNSFNDGRASLRSPFNGFVATLLVANGDYVQPGTPIAKIYRKGDINITAELPVRYAQQLRKVERANIEISAGEVYSVNKIDNTKFAIGHSVNECNMIPVTLTTSEISDVVPGSIVTLYLSSKNNSIENIVIPRSAIVEEMGNYFVFVQNTPISFEKRSVTIGTTDGLMVKVHSGVSAGERVVTKGAVILKLSQGAATLDPHAGHVH